MIAGLVGTGSLWVIIGVIYGQALRRRGLEQAVVGAEKNQTASSCLQELAIGIQGSRKMERIRRPQRIALNVLASASDGGLVDRDKAIEILPIFGEQVAHLSVFIGADRVFPQSSREGAPQLNAQQMGGHSHGRSRRNKYLL
jgi:hypothetical protein